MKTKICNTCKVEKSLEEFYKDERYKNGRRPKCNLCNTTVQRNSYKNNKNKKEFKEKRKNNSLKWKYGISLYEYNKLFNEQDGLCAVCSIPSEKVLCVDHDHKTGAIRALVCDRCNRTMGHCNDDIEILKLCVKYLESF